MLSCRNIPFLFVAAMILFSCSKDVNYSAPQGNTDMAINHYSYDKITINNQKYETDLVILPGGQIKDWAFDRESHYLVPDDFKGLITADVQNIIIGRGYHSHANLTKEAQVFLDEINDKGIGVHFLSTTDAVNLFNASSKEGLLAFIHIRY